MLSNNCNLFAGLPPIESKTNKKKVNEALNYNNSVLYSNNTNNDNMTIEIEDNNGNRTASVADLRKKFDVDMPCNTPKTHQLQIDGPTVKISENKFKKNDIETQNKTNGKLKSTPISNGVKRSTSKLNGDVLLANQTIKEVTETKLNGYDDVDDDDNVDDTINNYELNKENGEKVDEKLNYEIKGGSNDDANNTVRHRVNNFASYIPIKDIKKCDNTNIDDLHVNGLKETDDNYLEAKDIGKSLHQNVS